MREFLNEFCKYLLNNGIVKEGESYVPESWTSGFVEEIRANDAKILEHLETLPELIQKKEQSNLLKSRDLDTMKLKMRNMESIIALVIAKEIDSEGKKVFSNESQRKTELVSKLASNDDYTSAQAEYMNKKQDLEIKGIEMDFLKRRFRAIEGISRIK